MEILNTIWTFIVSNIITQPAYFIGLIVLLGYILLKKPWYDVLAGTIKAIVG
jgi:PTS system ascorbate-specific IIC component